MKEQQFDKHFNLKTYKPENLPDHTYEKKQRLIFSVARSKAQIIETATIKPFVIFNN